MPGDPSHASRGRRTGAVPWQAWNLTTSRVPTVSRRMMMLRVIGLAVAAAIVTACGNDSTAPTQNDTSMSFFVTSARSTTGNLGGLRGADGLCQNLATA